MIGASLYLPDPEKDEKIIMILRRHSFIMVGTIMVYVLLLLVPLVIRWFFVNQFSAVWEDSFVHPVIFLGGSVYYLFIVLFLFVSFIDYWLDVWVVTNERIISVEQRGLFARTMVEQKLYTLQDVTSKVDGFFPTVFHYGNVLVQTAGPKQNTDLRQVPHADTIARKIMELMEESKQRHGMEKE